MKRLGVDDKDPRLGFLGQGTWPSEVTLVGKLEMLPEETRTLPCIVMGESFSRKEVVDLALNWKVRHIVQKKGLALDRSVGFAASALSESGKLFESPLDFLVGASASSVLRDPEALFQYEVKALAKQKEAIDTCEEDLAGIECTQGVRSAALYVASELAMNLVHDAPKYYQRMHGQDEKLAPSLPMKFFLAYDRQFLMLGSVDNYGSLDVFKLLRGLDATYRRDLTPVNMSPGEGAGIGVRMIYDVATSLGVFVRRGKQSVIFCLIPRTMTDKRRMEVPKNLHWEYLE